MVISLLVGLTHLHGLVSLLKQLGHMGAILVRWRGDFVCLDTGPEHRGTVLMPHYGVAPLYGGPIPGLNSRRLGLEQIVLEGLCLGSKHFSLVCLSQLDDAS